MSEVFIVTFHFERGQTIYTLGFSSRKKALKHINSQPRSGADLTYFTIEAVNIDKEKSCDTK